MGIFGGGNRVLLAGGEGIVLYSPMGKGIRRETSIAWDVPNFEQQLMSILSRQNSGQPLVVLFDGADQTYRKEENIPKLSPFDRPRFVQRKLELAFPSHPVRAAAEIKNIKIKGLPPPEKKETPSYLFVALAETENVDRAAASIFESGVPVTGFGLLPAESSGLVTEMAGKLFAGQGRRSRWAVLVGQHETGGLRQIVTKDGNLALTRLTPTTEKGANGAGWAEEVMQEFKATLTYISRFGYKPEEGLDVIVVCGDVEKQFFDQKTLPVTHLRCVNIDEALQSIGMRVLGAEKGNFADALHAGWASKKMLLSLPVKVPSIHRLVAPRMITRYGSVALVLTVTIGSVFCTQSYQDYAQTQEKIAERLNLKEVQEHEYAEAAKVFDTLPFPIKEVKATIAVKDLLDKNTINLRSILHRLKEATGDDVFLNELSISHKANPAIYPSDSGKGGNLAAMNIDPEDRGTVRIDIAFGLPHTAQLADRVRRAKQLLSDLKAAFPDYKVVFKKQFGNVSKTGKFTGGTGAADISSQMSTVERAEISLEGGPL